MRIEELPRRGARCWYLRELQLRHHPGMPVAGLEKAQIGGMRNKTVVTIA